MQWIQRYIFLLNIFTFSTKPAANQVTDFSRVPSLHEGDSIHIVSLITNGIEIKRNRVVCWFPNDSLTIERMNGIADTINTGIAAVEKLIGSPLAWQAHPHNQPYIFYFRRDSIISHASMAGFVSISFWRIKEGKAPWLHEAVHEILYAKENKWFSKEISDSFYYKNITQWLYEGIADYISQQVSSLNNLPVYDVFSGVINPDSDSLFVENMKTANSQYILSFIGIKGVMPELSSANRRLYAPGFYHGSCSFVKFIADRYGVELLLKAISTYNKEQETIERTTGLSMKELKKEWLRKLNLLK